jgi:predicted regulator of Ras-like GTPase activity (Roadblock/LC7/MglB family)
MSDVYTSAVERLSRVDGVRGALIAEVATGVPVVAELAHDVSGDALAAVATALFRHAGRAAEGGALGPLQSVQLESEAGHVVAVAAGELVLVVLTSEAAQLGLIRLEAHRAAGSLE